jgi:hypothetical protein
MRIRVIAATGDSAMTTTQEFVPTKVLLVGSVALDTVQEVFHVAGKLLGRRLARVPDGEPGGRRAWISWQYPLLRSNVFLTVSSDVSPVAGRFPQLCIAEGVAESDLRFGELGYAREARASYLDFVAARKAGDIPAAARFQVCLPTPLAVISAFCRGKDMAAIERAYERAMIAEVTALANSIPDEDLCIQWDVCNELLMWDGQVPAMVPAMFAGRDLMRELIPRIACLINAVPPGVECGVHLCYGDFDGKHFADPRDAGKMTEFANAIAERAKRSIDYIHMPVPIRRNDDAFFKPLGGLRLRPETEIFLGVVHTDGAAKTKERIACARKYVPKFGIATECGIARKRKPELVRSLLEIYAAASQEPR